MGSASIPDPKDASTTEELKAQLRRLKAWSGLSFRELERRADSAGDVLPYSTGSAMLSPRRRGLPREELIAAFTRACGCTPEQISGWIEARRRIAASPATAALPPQPAPPQPAVPGLRQCLSTALAPRRQRAASMFGRSRRKFCALAIASALLLLVGTTGAVNALSAGDTGKSMLLSDRCPASMGLNTYGKCARELQRGLQRKGLRLPEDAWYGPFTKQRILAFQALAGLPPTGIADRQTQRALLADKPVTPPQWSTAATERRIREVFKEAPGQAVTLARCLSYLDSFWTIADKHMVRYWGLFQFSDLELLDFRATPAQALNPEWNIQQAYSIYSRTRDFRHWTCP
ncbi:peptidoglycan-binding domain-containing protein [Actinomadura rudentiformis]|uniref:Peptidoglycan-binding protein n=1 Tax=Actinomadura rudentiformis TaxID=359158 RepID=A0A6H9YJ14_9ACTN|nr:peptidoglycan-binding domain-containing protein [Actinomadura rudentiformis]KAB2339800.1 peptidoglycan-binding protein [Actinomadura rudentiformis]